jgi:hypothetical protein
MCIFALKFLCFLGDFGSNVYLFLLKNACNVYLFFLKNVQNFYVFAQKCFIIFYFSGCFFRVKNEITYWTTMLLQGKKAQHVLSSKYLYKNNIYRYKPGAGSLNFLRSDPDPKKIIYRSTTLPTEHKRLRPGLQVRNRAYTVRFILYQLVRNRA